MRLWRDHYGPERIAMAGNPEPLNAVATKSNDGDDLFVKLVNPTAEEVPVEIAIADGFRIGRAELKLVAPGALDARNTLENPSAVAPRQGRVEVRRQDVRFALPRWSAASLTLTQQQTRR